MTELHYDEDVIIEYLASPDEYPDKEAVEEHLLTCKSCRGTVDSYQEFSQALSDPQVWERENFVSMLNRSDESRLNELIQQSQELDREYDEAGPMIEKLMELDSEAREEFIDLSPELWTSGVVGELTERAHAAVERSPIETLELSTLAVCISEKLSLSKYKPGVVYHLRGMAWKEYAQALKYLGRYPEALQALDTAESTFAKATISEFDLAVAAFVRATILRDLNRVGDALDLAQKSAEVFAQFGHNKRYLHAKLLEAAILYSRGELRRAKDTWIGLLGLAQAENDVSAFAAILQNIGACCVDLGEHDAASTYLLQAIAIFKDLKQKPAALRGQWILGRMLISNRKYGEALIRLRAVHEEYESIHMDAEAGLVALEIVEALLATDRAEEGALVCRYLVERFTLCGMSSNAITAISYLREALAAGKATPALAKHVRNYVADVPQQPELLFLPLPA